MARRPVVIAYDIRANARRRRVHRILQDWRMDGQKSVVETRLSAGEARELFLQLSGELHQKEDRLALVWLDSRYAPLGAGQGRPAGNLRYKG